MTGLPTELLLKIIPHVLPEGFQSLALTCKTIHELCKPFIERHNHLSLHFRKFSYEFQRDPLLPTIHRAFELITRIAIEPIVALYIREADFSIDSWPQTARSYPDVPDVYCGDPVATLLADSPYLVQASLDWKEYYNMIKKDVESSPPYSQHAATFLLTLLPNVKRLMLPRLWKPLDKTNKLFNVIIQRTKQSYFPWHNPSLAEVTTFESPKNTSQRYRFELKHALPFLALPHVRLFLSHRCVVTDDTFMSFISKDPDLRCSETLEAIYLPNSSIDEVAIGNFLRHVPCLKILKYSHWDFRNEDREAWNICKFLATIEREAGSHLEELSVSMRDNTASTVPGTVSMRGFQRLRKLEIPLEIVTCNINHAISRVVKPTEVFTDHELDMLKPLIGDLIPASVSELLFLTIESDRDGKVLEVLFRDFATKKDSQLPSLKEIYLHCPWAPKSNLYNEQCAK